MELQPTIESFFEEATGTISHVVYDEPGGRAAVIDPVLNYDPRSGRTSTTFADRLLAFLEEQDLALDWILETHAHADHLSAAHYLRSKRGGKIAIGEQIRQVQGVFKQLYNLDDSFAADGSQFDQLLCDGESISIGKLQARALFLPGHTAADVAFQIGDTVFVGDTLFMPDVGTARCDFPGGNAGQLYRSLRKLLALPPATRLYMCHDYPPAGRAPAWISTVAEQLQHNIHAHDGVDEPTFVQVREARDAGLEKPLLLLPSIQVNIRAGALPPPEPNGISYLKIPLNRL